VSWQLERAYEREEIALDQALQRDEISLEEYNRSLRELRRDYTAELQAEAGDAYDAVMKGDY